MKEKKNNMNMAGSQLFSVIGTPGAKEGSGHSVVAMNYAKDKTVGTATNPPYPYSTIIQSTTKKQHCLSTWNIPKLNEFSNIKMLPSLT